MNAPTTSEKDGDAFLGVRDSLTGRFWRSRLSDERPALALAQRHQLPDIVARILAARGVTAEQAERYLAPSLRRDLPDPGSLTDMDRACARLADAIAAGERIAVFGDYDVDGATSAALLHRYFEAIGVPLRIYIPDRLKEGYGPNAPALKRLREEGIDIVITVDCGISAHEALGEAREAGLDVIVVDHHLAESQLPPAAAVVNPNRLDDESGLGQLAAVGVSFMVLVGLNRTLRRRGLFEGRSEPDLRRWLDLVALGTICDVVPLTGVNRALVVQGLRVMARRENIGLSALCDVARLETAPGVYHGGFVLGPRVNAGGRVGRAEYGATLLSTGDAVLAQRIARELDAFNSERQEIEARVLDEAIATVEREGRANDPCIVATGRGWHPGVIGIVASRLKDRYNRPVAVVALEDGVGKGSARSLPGVDLGSAITAARQSDLLINGGGHAMAAGFTVAEEGLEALTAFLCTRLEEAVRAATLVRALNIDAALTPGAANTDLLRRIEQAGPFGAGNPEPRLAVASAAVVKADPVGENHVRCILSGGEGGRLQGIAFRCLDNPLGGALLNAKGRTFHLAGHLRANHWQGVERIQLVIDDGAVAA